MESKIRGVLNNLYKYRFIICGIIFIIAIVFEISGSSLGAWNDVIYTIDQSNDIGISRQVRADEWATYTPMMFSQKYNNYKMISSLLRGGNTNVFFVYGLPIMSIFQVYRPFQLGFLFLGNAKGLSFFWIGRFLALFLVSLEFFKILTKNNKGLTYIGTILVTLSPIINWWFAINGIVEIFVFGEGAIVLLYHYMNDKNFTKKLIYLLLMIICAGGYIMVLYPAWQVPMIYVFLFLALWVIIGNYKNMKIKKKDILSIIISIIIFAVSMIFIFLSSKDVIDIVMHTDYPGSRFELGGGQALKYISYIINPMLPYTDAPIGLNQSEAALMFGLFPIGLILSIIALIKNKKKDLLLILLMVCYLFLGMWCVFGFPEILAKASLLYTSPAHRSFIAVGFLDILLLIRSLSLLKDFNIKKIYAVIIAVLLTCLMIYLYNIFYPNYLTIKKLIVIIPILLSLFYLFLSYSNKICRVILLLEITIVMCFTSLTINPIRQGTGIIDNSPIIKGVKQIDSVDKGVWITEGMGYPATNYIINAGVKNINGTNTYPNLKLWKKLDKNGTYKYIYNRYAHINMKLCDNENSYSNKFELVSQDVFKVYVTMEDLEKLNVKYIFTINNFDDNNSLVKLYSYNKYNIYKVVK